MYSPQLLDHFEHPRNAGELENPDAHVRIENPACGDILELYACIRDGVISEIRFKAKGCVPAISCGSLVTEMALGKTPSEAIAISKEDLIKEIGGLPTASGHAAVLAADALRTLSKRLTATP
jgi:nitrogen fixation NifU-like protein